MGKTKSEMAAIARNQQYLGEDGRKAFQDRLARIEGHVRAIRAMVQERRRADEILLQVAAAKGALNKFASVFVEHELKVCVNTCMPGNRDERLDKVTRVLTTLLKQS